MEAPRHIIDYLKPREGWETEVYVDTEGHPTAGMGHLLTGAERATYQVGDTVPPQVLERWTRADTAGAYAAALGQAGELGLASDMAFVTVLTSVNYQLGIHWRSKFPRTWKAIMEGRWDLAAEMVLGSRWASQTPSRAREFAAQLIQQGGKARKPRRLVRGAVAVGIAISLALLATAAITCRETSD